MISVLEPLDLGSDEGRQRIARLYRYAQIGHCVSSVTHDVNNFLGAIMAYAELIGMDSPLNQESVRMIEEIMGAVRKSSTLVNSLTAIARKERDNISLVDPAQLVEKVVDLRRYDLKAAQIAIDTAYESDMPMLVADQPKLEQALIYVIANAIEELHDRERRMVKIRVRHATEGVEIDIWNSGREIPEELREAIFQPFFTTKKEDHLGLGLAVTRDIMQYHGGDISYDPKRGFVFYLPRETALSSRSTH